MLRRAPECGRHHGLVLVRVERACRIHAAAADGEELDAAAEDCELEFVERKPHAGIPPAPHVGRFADGSIPGARHVAEHAVEGETSGGPVLALQQRELLRFVVCDQHL